MGERNTICRVPVLARARCIKCKQRCDAIRNEKQNTRMAVITFQHVADDLTVSPTPYLLETACDLGEFEA